MPLEDQGILVRRSREVLEREIEQFSIVERDGLIIACAALYPIAELAVGQNWPAWRSTRSIGMADGVTSCWNASEGFCRGLGLKTLFVLTAYRALVSRARLRAQQCRAPAGGARLPVQLSAQLPGLRESALAGVAGG